MPCTAATAGMAGCPAPASAGHSLGECAGIGVGMALGMAALVAGGLVLWRWWRRRMQASHDVQRHALHVRLLKAERQRDDFELEAWPLRCPNTDGPVQRPRCGRAG